MTRPTQTKGLFIYQYEMLKNNVVLGNSVGDVYCSFLKDNLVTFIKVFILFYFFSEILVHFTFTRKGNHSGGEWYLLLFGRRN